MWRQGRELGSERDAAGVGHIGRSDRACRSITTALILSYEHRVMKPLQLLSLLPRRPKEFAERTSAIIASRWESVCVARPNYEAVSPEEARQLLSAAMGPGVEDCLNEPALSMVENEILERRKKLPAE